MAGLVPAIHVYEPIDKQDVDARDKRGHDDRGIVADYIPYVTDGLLARLRLR
jgi:hypothetical protein